MSNPTHEVQEFLSRWSAVELAGDSAALDSLLTDDFMAVGPLGFMLSKQDWTDRFANGLAHLAYELQDVRTRTYGDVTVGIGLLRQEGTHQGNPIPAAARATFILVKESGALQVAGMQMSFVAGTSGAPPIPGRLHGTSSGGAEPPRCAARKVSSSASSMASLRSRRILAIVISPPSPCWSTRWMRPSNSAAATRHPTVMTSCMTKWMPNRQQGSPAAEHR